MTKAKSVTMPEQYWDKLYKETTETGLTLSELLRRAVDVYFQNKEKSA